MGSSEERVFGADLSRREDPVLLSGDATYTDDISSNDLCHLGIHRSQYGHAEITAIDTAAAGAIDGVIAVYTWADVESSDAPGELPTAPVIDEAIPGHPMLAHDRVRYQGEPLAAVVAEDRYTANDAIEAIDVSYDPLDPVVDTAETTTADAPPLFDAAPNNVATTTELGDRSATDAAFEDADRVIELELVNNRLIPNPIETRAALSRYEAATGSVDVVLGTQSPHRHRKKLAYTLGLQEAKIHLRVPHVGGGFGHKGHHHPGDALAVWASMQTNRPVKWVATRTENYAAGAHGRDHVSTGRLAFDDDGTIRGLQVETNASVGAYSLGSAPRLAGGYGALLASQYLIPAIHCRTDVVFTNTAPVHSYRGAGRPEAIYVTERLVGAAARALDMDPTEFRRRNLIPADAFPHETAVGASYDSGDYERGLGVALEAVDYEALTARRAQARAEGRLFGIGIAAFTESTGSGYHGGLVRVHPTGGATAYVGTHSHGQGHGTTYAQILADALGLPYEDIEIVEADTESSPAGSGTSGSRSTVTGGGALAKSAGQVREKATAIAAHLLEAPERDITLQDNEFTVRGAPDRSVDFGTVADAAYSGDLPKGMERGLEATVYFAPEENTYSFGTHVAAVEVDRATGDIDVLRYLAHNDCGERVNPTLIEGQIHGAVAQGIGQALLEHAEYDDAGNLQTGSMQDYAVPKAFDVPDMETAHTVTPSPRNELGVKGVAEAGTIGAPPAIVNAVVDALAPEGVDPNALDMPLTGESVWRALADAR